MDSADLLSCQCHPEVKSNRNDKDNSYLLQHMDWSDLYVAIEGMKLFESCRKMKSMRVHFKNAHSGDLNC